MGKVMEILIVVCMCLIPSLSLGMDCSHPYIKLATGCYYFSGSHTANWWKAAEVCRALDGYLAIIGDPIENESIRQYLINQDHKNHYYLGGYDLGHEGIWYWESTRKPIDYFDWYKPQPDNYKDVEHCLEMRNTSSFHWNDVYCRKDTNSFVCEAAIPEKKEIVLQVTGIKLQVEPDAQQPEIDWRTFQAS